MDEAWASSSGSLPEAWVTCVGTLGSSEAGAGAAVVGTIGAGAAEGATAS